MTPRWVVNGFILFNLIAVIIFTPPRPPSKQTWIEKVFVSYLWHTRLLQHWELFVPSPRKYAMKYRVEILFKNGDKKTWQRPYPPNWDFFDRHLAYHFQKWDLASNYLEWKDILWRDLEQFIEKKYSNPTNPPASIALVRSQADWPPPHEYGYVMHEDSELKWRDQVIFTYVVTEKRFR